MVKFATQAERIKEIRCPKPKCTGTLFREAGSRLAEALNVMQLRCDVCGTRYGQKVDEK